MLVAAQRLVRLICPTCKIPAEVHSPESLLEIGFSKKELKEVRLYRGKGCDECAETGYRGRIALYEVLPMSDDLRDMVVARSHAVDIRKKSIELGMRSLRDSGLDKVRRGMTTVEEVLRVTTVD